MSNESLRGIASLDKAGTEPIGAALSVGKKSDSGQPTDRDRFYVQLPQATLATYKTRDGRDYNALKRDGHPSFAKFNEAEPEKRRTIPARLAHLHVEDCWHGSLFCMEAPKLGKRPNKAPVCVGNGVHADRWVNGKIARIPCPDEQCEFRQRPVVNGREGKAPCTPRLTFFARFDWPRSATGGGFPNIPFKFTSNSLYTYRNFVGFFDAFNTACRGFGVDPRDVPLFGLPVTISLQERTNAAAGTKFPVVSIAVSGDGDLLAWVQQQLSNVAEIRRMASTRMLPSLTDRQVIEATYADTDLTDGPPSIPGAK